MKHNTITTDKDAWPLCIEIAKRYNSYQRLLDSNKELLQALKDATERMERARGILKRDGETNWGMLDTSDLQPAITNAKNLQS